jgi:uridylate kinase
MTYAFKKNTIVIDLGGSIVHPGAIDVDYIKQLDKFIRKEIKKGRRFLIVVGGGKLARVFIEAAEQIAPITDEEKDWIGVYATRLNGQLLRAIFEDVVDPIVIHRRYKLDSIRYPVTIASGWQPGWSTDFVSMALASDLDIKEVIIAGKPDHVYDKDFSKYPDAKLFTEMTWREYRKLIPSKWKPGFSSPVDPVAAKHAESHKLTGIVIDGRDLKNFKDLLDGKKFEGTIIT